MAGDNDVLSDASEIKLNSRHFKCCKKKETSVVMCIKCGNTFHISCFERDFPQVKVLEDFRTVCCVPNIKRIEDAFKFDGNKENDSNPQIQQKLQIENQYLKALLAEVQSKNEILLSNNKLLEEKIVVLMNEIKTKNINTSYQQCVISKLENERGQNMSEKNEKEINSVKETNDNKQRERHQTYPTKNLQRPRITLSQVNLATSEALKSATQTPSMSSPNSTIIKSDSLSLPPSTIDKSKNEKEFTKVTYAKMAKFRKVHATKVGTSIEKTEENGIIFAGREHNKKAWLFISHVKDNVTTQIVKQHIINKAKISDPSKVIVNELEVNYQRKDCKCFMVGIDFSLKEQVYNEDFWPAGVTYRRYNFNFRKATVSNNTQNFSTQQ